MSEEFEAEEAGLQHFLSRVRVTGEVWVLESSEFGYANCASDDDEDTDVILFWSSAELAAKHQRDEWELHQPSMMSAEDFVERWLRGMHDDGVLAGVDWDEDFNGVEIDAAELARLLTEEESDDEEEDVEEEED